MINVTIIDSNGEVIRSLSSGSLETLYHNIESGEQYVESAAPAEPSYWDFKTSKWKTKVGSPGPWAVWDPVSKSWSDPRTLETLKALKWEAMKTAREAATVAPFMDTPFGLINAGIKSSANIKDTLSGLAAVIVMGGTVEPVKWTMADDSYVELTYAELALIGAMLLQRGEAAHETARVLRADIEACTTAAQVEAIVWP